MKLNTELLKYIETNIFPEYEKNDLGHNIEHINYVIEKSLKHAKSLTDLNINMVYTIAAYHDIGHHIDAKNHEKVSAQILKKDSSLKEYFNDEEINIMSEAIEDHRASLEYIPRSVYGKMISSADRNTSIEEPLKRTYEYRIKHNPNDSLEKIIEESRKHILEKFGKDGYAKDKIYFGKEEYERFLKNITDLAENEEEFKKKYIEVNGLKPKIMSYNK